MSVLRALMLHSVLSPGLPQNYKRLYQSITTMTSFSGPYLALFYRFQLRNILAPGQRSPNIMPVMSNSATTPPRSSQESVPKKPDFSYMPPRAQPPGTKGRHSWHLPLTNLVLMIHPAQRGMMPLPPRYPLPWPTQCNKRQPSASSAYLSHLGRSLFRIFCHPTSIPRLFY